MLAEHVAGQLVPEVAAQPSLVGVVAVATAQVERDPADAALGKGELQVRHREAAIAQQDLGARDVTPRLAAVVLAFIASAPPIVPGSRRELGVGTAVTRRKARKLRQATPASA